MASLFKYIQPGLLSILRNLSFRFSPVADFNDPFECLSDASIVSDPDWQRTGGLDATRIDSLLAFPGRLISCIYLGGYAAEIEPRVVALCQRPELAHVRVFRMELDPEHYRLNAVQIRPTSV